MKKFIKNKWLWLLIALTIISTFICCYYVYYEDNVYVYDYVGYQLKNNLLAETIKLDPLKAINDIIFSIRNLDYNMVPVIFLAPLNLLFGSSRIIYELSITIFFIVPVCFLLIYFIYNNLRKDKNNNVIMIVFISLLTLTFTKWWSPSLRGLPDIIGVLPLIALIFCLKNVSFLEKNNPFKLVLIGILVYLPFLCRRWYAYNIVAFYGSLFTVELLIFLKSDQKTKIIKFKNAIINFLLSGISTISCALIFQFPLINHIINENYSNSYSAFQIEFSQHFINFFNEFGAYVIILALFAVFYSFYKKTNRKLTLYCLLNIVIFCLFFCRTQGIGVHHYLGIALYLFILFIMGILYLVEYLITNKHLKMFCMIVISSLSVLNYVTTFFNSNMNIPYFFANTHYYRFKYDNYDNLIMLENKLSDILTNDKAKFMVTGSTSNIADSLLDVLGDDVVKNSIVYNSTVDLRDGINLNGLLSKYVVVAYPEQYAMDKNGQQVMLYTNNLILNNEGIGKAYKKITNKYELSHGCTVYIYEKERAFTDEEADNYMEYFYKLYPEWKEKYSDLFKLLLTSEYKLGANIGDFKIVDDHTIFMQPGSTETEYYLNVNNINNLKIKMYISSDIPESIDTAGIVNLKIYQDGSEIGKYTISKNTAKTLNLDLKNISSLKFVVDSGDELSYDWLYLSITDYDQMENL